MLREIERLISQRDLGRPIIADMTLSACLRPCIAGPDELFGGLRRRAKFLIFGSRSNGSDTKFDRQSRALTPSV
jgi:hypothetical protein